MKLSQILEAKYAQTSRTINVKIGRRTFEAERVFDYGTKQANDVLGQQQKKVERVADKLNITWKKLYVKRIWRRQRGGYPDLQIRTFVRRPDKQIFTYVLVGNDSEGNEFKYYKYEAHSPQSGQSYVYGNDRNQIKLSWVLHRSVSAEDAKNRLLKGQAPKKPDDYVPNPLRH